MTLFSICLFLSGYILVILNSSGSIELPPFGVRGVPQEGADDTHLPKSRVTPNKSQRKKQPPACPRQVGRQARLCKWDEQEGGYLSSAITYRSGFGKQGTVWSFIFLSQLGIADRGSGEPILVRIFSLCWFCDLPVTPWPFKGIT